MSEWIVAKCKFCGKLFRIPRIGDRPGDPNACEACNAEAARNAGTWKRNA